MAYETTLAVIAFGATFSGKAMLGQRGLKRKTVLSLEFLLFLFF